MSHLLSWSHYQLYLPDKKILQEELSKLMENE